MPTTNSPPSLVGVWTGVSTGHTLLEGFRQTNRTLYNITEQQGSAFAGTHSYTRKDGKTYSENLSGVIGSDGQIYMADHDSGVTNGEFVGPDEIELRYIQDGADAKAYIIRLTRQKI